MPHATMAPIQPSQEELERRRIVGINPETVTNTASTDFPGHWPGEDYAWDLEKFKENLKIQFHYNQPFDASFSLVGIDTALANAFRRILIAEVPTLAIEYVFIHNNTSIVQDEVLSQRLGLIPLKGSVDGLNWMSWFKKPSEPGANDGSTPADYNTIVLKLDVTCKINPGAGEGGTDPRKKYEYGHVYAKDLRFEAVGRQTEYFTGEGEIKAVNPDILIAKMRPGQQIELDLHCIKGIGQDHAKFSPVATATYRLLPHIDIRKPILGADARKFQACFPKGVIGLEKVTAEEAAQSNSEYAGHEGEDKAVVKDAFKDTVSRECLRHEEFQGKVKLGRVRDHFIFSVESTGQFNSDVLFLEAVKVLKFKASRLKRNLAELI
ncbi:putative dna-directed rna polymerase i and iii subunit [Phaeomoniella chlamydospora]|uniref:DNA-directed RNA polymerases I and III subunit RPAC1 n=1 Tax=Phaeomoniella chlamydospora TaxID=158046 RepID=A0A0G2ERP9_PHACM|nr:putative dna-directed rna polymerase i and iii subunit [Phaeomoniella chlamydospora]